MPRRYSHTHTHPHTHNKFNMADGRHFKINKSPYFCNGSTYGNKILDGDAECNFEKL